MHYKTIVLGLLIQRPRLHVQLKKERKLLSTLEQYAKDFKASHEAWQAQLSQAKPSSDPAQIASEALELALQDLEDCLRSEFPEDSEPQSLEVSTTFHRRPTPPA